VYGSDDRHLLYPNYKEGIRTLNAWYNEGLVWKDFALYTDSTEEDNMMKAGYVGAFMHNWDYPFRNGEDSIAANLIRNVGEDAMYIPIDCFQNDAGITRKFLGSVVGSDRKTFLPAPCEEPLAALLYINFISSADTIKYLQTGLEGTNFELTADGAYQILPATGEWVKNSGNNIDYTMTVNGLYLGEATDASTALSYPGIPADIVIQANAYSKTNGRIVKHFNVGTIEAENDVGTSLTSKRDALLTKAVTASVEDFDAEFDAGMADYLASGGQAIIDERIEKLAEVYGIQVEK
jgi:putative aldouronate transport system substrate-binding protein